VELLLQGPGRRTGSGCAAGMWRQRSGAATPCRSEGGDPL